MSIMLTIMNSKLPDKLLVLTNKTKFSKKVNPIKYPVQTYILVRTWNLLFMYFTGVSHWIMKSRLSVKKHLTWLKLYLVIISALELKVNKPKNHLSLTVPKTWFFSEFFCSVSSSHLRPFNFICAFNWWTKWMLQKLKKLWKKHLIHQKKSF